MDVVQAAEAEAGSPQTRVYRRRWVILLLFVCALMLNAVPWMQYVVLADVVTKYYNVSYETVEWTSLVYNVTSMVLIVPTAFILDKYGGVTLGCFLAPLTARANWTQEENFKGFLALNMGLAIGAILLFVAVVFLFKQAPPLPPSPAQAAAAVAASSGNYFKSVRSIIKKPSFLLLLVSFNLIVSVFVAITTVINRDITEFFPDRAAETGYLATLKYLTGMGATMVFGVILDRTKKFKELSVITYFGGVVSVVMYSVCIATSPMEVLYVATGIMGIFMSSYFVPAYEYAVELTYPEAEGNPTSVLNWTVQPVSLTCTLVYSRIFSSYGPHVAHGFLVALMVVGFVCLLFIPRDYRRLEAELALAKDAGADKPLMKHAMS